MSVGEIMLNGEYRAFLMLSRTTQSNMAKQCEVVLINSIHFTTTHSHSPPFPPWRHRNVLFSFCGTSSSSAQVVVLTKGLCFGRSVDDANTDPSSTMKDAIDEGRRRRSRTVRQFHWLCGWWVAERGKCVSRREIGELSCCWTHYQGHSIR